VGKLARTGSLASFFGFVEHAQTIFTGIGGVRPSNLDVLINLAITKINAGYTTEAIEILQNQVLNVEPENWTAKCFLGLALKQVDHNHQGNKILQEVIAVIGDKKDPTSLMADSFLKAM
jgi:Flp pilus assembly protein TadD